MYVIERRQWLIEHARRTGRVDVAEMSSELSLAPETIRRDLKDLERQGLLRRVYGGAVPIERLSFESALSIRATRRQAQKNRIAAAQSRTAPISARPTPWPRDPAAVNKSSR